MNNRGLSTLQNCGKEKNQTAYQAKKLFHDQQIIQHLHRFLDLSCSVKPAQVSLVVVRYQDQPGVKIATNYFVTEIRVTERGGRFNVTLQASSGVFQLTLRTGW